jgi:hypothetical protein
MNRRRFIGITAAGAAAAGTATFMANTEWLFPRPYPGDTKKVFSRCGACSQTMFCILNREFANPQKTEELSSDPLAGGLMNTQHQCGMIWGSTLAAGAEAYRRYKDTDTAVSKTFLTSQKLVSSLKKRAGSINCRNIIGTDISDKLSTAKMMLKSLPGGFDNMICMNLAEKWAPEAIDTVKSGLTDDQRRMISQPKSCACEVAKMMGAGTEEMVTVAGLAGGIGLSGEGCGALGAAIYLNTLDWCRENPGKSGYKNPGSKKILDAFLKKTDGEFLCRKISGEKFESVDDHTDYIDDGGCSKMINILAESRAYNF